MRTLYHFPLCPNSRTVRLALKEKGLPFELMTEPFWEHRENFMAMNPFGDLPVLVEEDMTLTSCVAILEYIEQRFSQYNLLGTKPNEVAAVRELVQRFTNEFHRDVVAPQLEEKVYSFYRQEGEPNSQRIRIAQKAMEWFMRLLEDKLGEHSWLAGEQLTLADLAAAGQLSSLDYLGLVDWRHGSRTKAWYALVKSRPCFRPILADRVPGFKPVEHYADPDF